MPSGRDSTPRRVVFRHRQCQSSAHQHQHRSSLSLVLLHPPASIFSRPFLLSIVFLRALFSSLESIYIILVIPFQLLLTRASSHTIICMPSRVYCFHSMCCYFSIPCVVPLTCFFSACPARRFVSLLLCFSLAFCCLTLNVNATHDLSDKLISRQRRGQTSPLNCSISRFSTTLSCLGHYIPHSWLQGLGNGPDR